MGFNRISIIIAFSVIINFVSTEKLPCGPHSINYHRYHYNGNCYFTYKSMFDMISWHTAEQNCLKYGGHLASFHSKAEWDFIKESIAKQELWFKDSYWIGMNAIGSSPLRWSDNTTMDYSDEITLESSTVENAFEKCVYVSRGVWTKTDCFSGNFLDFSYICKVTPPTTTTGNETKAVTVQGECNAGWTKHNNWCRKAFGFNRTGWLGWSEALKFCKQFHTEGSLVTVHSNAEQVEITTMLRGLEAKPWIGLKRVLGEFRWADVTALKGFDNWDEGEPRAFNELSVNQFHIAGNIKLCVSASINKHKPGKWTTESNCSEAKPFVCQVLPDPKLPKPETIPESVCKVNGYQHYGKSCYKVFKNETLDWQRAENRCKADGGHLASIVDGFEQSFVQTLVWTYESPLFWIGLSDNESTLLKWSNGDSLSFVNWQILEPRESNQTRCVVFEKNRGKWMSSGCDLVTGFICEIKNVTDSIDTSLAINTLNSTCPYSDTVSWIDVGTENCFYLEKDAQKKKSWYEAKRTCAANGGSLANLHNLNELEKLRTKLISTSESFWIGLYRDEEGVWQWTDGTPVNSPIWRPPSISECLEIENPYEFLNCTISRTDFSDLKPVCSQWTPLSRLFEAIKTCNNLKPYLCQVPKMKPEASIPTAPSIPIASTRQLPAITSTSTTRRRIPFTTPSSGFTFTETASVYRYNTTGRKEKLVNHEQNEAKSSSIVVVPVLIVLALVVLAVGVTIWVYRRQTRRRVVSRSHSFTNTLFETSDGNSLSFTNRMCDT